MTSSSSRSRAAISNLIRLLDLPDPVLISLLALGLAFYIPLGVRRGYIQGIQAFGSLAINFMLEGKNSAELTNLIGSGNPNTAAVKFIKPEIKKLLQKYIDPIAGRFPGRSLSRRSDWACPRSRGSGMWG